ncbi:MAG TPA: hypothetical protein VFA52_04035 [Candidatus Paceibacterota bacterium]|jgi:hypothetical protein|nr:hypothetical protein [Candidatus Paceibacterota bacterium]
MNISKQASMGKYLSHGEDFLHLINRNGEILFSIDGKGTVHTPRITFFDGTTQISAAAITETSIDAGTF